MAGAAVALRCTVPARMRAETPVCHDPSIVRPTLLIVDDHEAFRASARTLLELEGFEVVGLAESGEEALTEVERLHPDVVLLDVQLPGADGFAVASALARQTDAPRVVLVSSRGRDAYAARLDDAPVRGFLSKSELSGKALLALVG